MSGSFNKQRRDNGMQCRVYDVDIRISVRPCFISTRRSLTAFKKGKQKLTTVRIVSTLAVKIYVLNLDIT